MAPTLLILTGLLCGLIRGPLACPPDQHQQPEPDAPTAANSPTPAPMPVAVPLAEYEPIDLAGFPVFVEPDLLADPSWPRVRAALLFDLELVVDRLPPAALGVVRQTPILVTLRTPPRPEWAGSSAACCHVSPGWLTANGYDAERAGAVEILHADKYLLWRAEQPMMLLHELAHAYHLRFGYDQPLVLAAYEAAIDAGRYDAVAYSLAPAGQPRRAYAATNQQEYFAELTEAYFGRNDYFPFTRDDLVRHDPAGVAALIALWFGQPPNEPIDADANADDQADNAARRTSGAPPARDPDTAND